MKKITREKAIEYANGVLQDYTTLQEAYGNEILQMRNNVQYGDWDNGDIQDAIQNSRTLEEQEEKIMEERIEQEKHGFGMELL